MQKFYVDVFLRKYTFLFIFVLLFSACSSDGERKRDKISIDAFELDESIFDEINEAKKIFYSLPSPLETAMLIKSAGAKYNEELLNPIENADQYTTNRSMALNLGIYTTNLSFASLFDQTQTSITYMGTAKKMADGLGILDAIDNNTIESLEANINNRDVIMDIISETFMSSSSFLKENDRTAIAALVLVGGWIEGLYLATQIVGESSLKDNKLVDRILEQKLSLDIVLRLLEEDNDDQDVQMIMVEMLELKKTFDKVKLTSSATETVYDEEANITILDAKTEVSVTPAVFRELRDKVKAIRSNFTL